MKNDKNTIFLEVSGHPGARVTLIGGKLPYLWVGSNTCFGCVQEEDVEKLRDMCNRILAKKDPSK